jgi:hypothetical protein
MGFSFWFKANDISFVQAGNLQSILTSNIRAACSVTAPIVDLMMPADPSSSSDLLNSYLLANWYVCGEYIRSVAGDWLLDRSPATAI